MTEEGADLTRLLTRLSLSLKRAVSPKAACPPEQYVAKGEKAGDLNMTKKKLGKISESWLSENASRRRALTGMYRMEDLADCARFLQRKLVAVEKGVAKSDPLV